jgi:hypothetical protein
MRSEAALTRRLRRVDRNGRFSIRQQHGELAATHVGKTRFGHLHPRLVDRHFFVVDAPDMAQVEPRLEQGFLISHHCRCTVRA